MFAGQRFCRSCGRPTASEEHTPTQQMPPSDVHGLRGQVNTAPSSRPDTSPVYNPQPPTYQPPSYPQAYGQYSAQQYPPPPTRSRSPWGWIIALIGIGLFAFIVLGIFVGVRAGREARRAMTPPRAAEPATGTGITEAKPVSIPLNKDATVSLKNISGKITVEGWDEPNAEVRIIKRGGSSQDQKDAKVLVDSDPTRLSLQLAPSRGNTNVTVEYEVKLPRQVGKIELSGASSDIELHDVNAATIMVSTASGSVEIVDANGDIIAKTASGEVNMGSVKGNITASSQSGSINISDVTGTVNTSTISGKTDVTFENLSQGGPLDFKSVSGGIDIQFQDRADFDLTAETVSGNIELNGDFGMEVEKRVVGARASGRVGSGGTPLRVKTVSGGIQLSK